MTTPQPKALPCGCTYFGEDVCRAHAAAGDLLAAVKDFIAARIASIDRGEMDLPALRAQHEAYMRMKDVAEFASMKYVAQTFTGAHEGAGPERKES